MITGNTKIIGILGSPVGHSLSPVMHNAAFEALALDYRYIPLPVAPEQLAAAVHGLKSMGFVGANVTIPHKVTIMPYLDELDPSAQLAGAVNTLVIKQGKCIGYNTDAQGFIQSLATKNIRLQGKTAVILGAGGAARAVACGLVGHGIASIMIGTRSAVKAEAFVESIPGATKLQGCDWDQPLFVEALTQCDLLINCTPLGMKSNSVVVPPINWQAVNKTAIVCDVVYTPPLTPLLAMAEQHGHVTINGAGMLIEQGALAFELWTGKSAPRDIMRVAVGTLL